MAKPATAEVAELVALRFSADWADEFQAEGIAIVDAQWWEDHQVEAKEKFGSKSREVYFGTNECFEFDDAEDYLGQFTKLDLTQEEIAILQKALGDLEFGIIPFVSDFDEDP